MESTEHALSVIQGKIKPIYFWGGGKCRNNKSQWESHKTATAVCIPKRHFVTTKSLSCITDFKIGSLKKCTPSNLHAKNSQRIKAMLRNVRSQASMNTSTIFQRLQYNFRQLATSAPEIHSTTASCRAARPWRPVSHNAIYWTLAAHQRRKSVVYGCLTM